MLSDTSQTKIWYKVEDNVGNITGGTARDILYDAGPKILGLKVTNSSDEELLYSHQQSPTVNWYGQDNLYVKVNVQNTLPYTVKVYIENKDTGAKQDNSTPVTSVGDTESNFTFNINTGGSEKGTGRWVVKAEVMYTGALSVIGTETNYYYFIDNTPPNVTYFDYNKSDAISKDVGDGIIWYKNVKLTTIAKDDDSGFAAGAIEYDIMDNNLDTILYGPISAGTQGDTTTGLMNLDDYALEGNIKIRATVKDRAGNIAVTSIIKNIDSKAPIITITKSSGNYTVDIKDNGTTIASGFYTVQSNDNKNTTTILSDDEPAGKVPYANQTNLRGPFPVNNYNEDVSTSSITVDKTSEAYTALDFGTKTTIDNIGDFRWFINNNYWFSVTAEDVMGNTNTASIQLAESPPEIEIKDGYDTDANGRIGIWTKVWFDLTSVGFDSTSNTYTNVVEYAWADKDINDESITKFNDYVDSLSWNLEKTESTIPDGINRQYNIGENIDIMKTDDLHEYLWVRAKNNKNIPGAYTYSVKKFNRVDSYFNTIQGVNNTCQYISEPVVTTALIIGGYTNGLAINMAASTNIFTATPTSWNDTATGVNAGDAIKFTILKPTTSNSDPEQVYYYFQIYDKVGNISNGMNYTNTIDAPDITQVKINDEGKYTVSNNEVDIGTHRTIEDINISPISDVVNKIDLITEEKCILEDSYSIWGAGVTTSTATTTKTNLSKTIGTSGYINYKISHGVNTNKPDPVLLLGTYYWDWTKLYVEYKYSPSNKFGNITWRTTTITLK